MRVKYAVIASATCHECDGVLLFASMLPNVIVVIDEYEAPLWWEMRERLKA